jgi:hypothetical protein
MSWSTLASNQWVSFNDMVGSGIALNSGQSHVYTDQFITKDELITKYNVDASYLSSLAGNQWVTKTLIITPATTTTTLPPTTTTTTTSLPPATINWSLTEAVSTGQYLVDGRLYIDYTDVNGNAQTLDVDTPSSGSITVKANTSVTAYNTSYFRGFTVPVDSTTITITVNGTPTSVAGDTISGSSTPITATAPVFTATTGSTYTVAASTSVVLTPILYPCMYVGYVGTTCCEAIAGYDPAAAPIYDGTVCGSFTLSSSSGNYFAIGSTIVDPYTGATVTGLGGAWIYDGTTCWHIDSTMTIYESGSCSTGSNSEFVKVAAFGDTTICGASAVVLLVFFSNTYSDIDSALASGATIYNDSVLTSPLVGYGWIVKSTGGQIYEINSSTGAVINGSGNFC